MRVTTTVGSRWSILRIGLFDQSLGGLPTTDLAFPVASALAIDVADGDDPHPLVLEERLDVVEALIAGSDHAHRDLIAGRGLPREPECRTRYDRGKCESSRCRLDGVPQEGATRGRGVNQLFGHSNCPPERHRPGTLRRPGGCPDSGRNRTLDANCMVFVPSLQSGSQCGVEKLGFPELEGWTQDVCFCCTSSVRPPLEKGGRGG